MAFYIYRKFISLNYLKLSYFSKNSKY
jgi:hypothetical protein